MLLDACLSVDQVGSKYMTPQHGFRGPQPRVIRKPGTKGNGDLGTEDDARRGIGGQTGQPLWPRGLDGMM